MSDEKKKRGRPRSEFSFDEIGEAAITELQRRLSTVREAAEIPGTQLAQIVQRYVAYLESTLENDEEEREKLSPLEAIDKPGLALEERYRILGEYLHELEAEWHESFGRYQQMKVELGIEEEAEDGNADPVSE